MKISECFHRNGPVFSFEFFPPKDAEADQRLAHAVDKLKQLDPSFVSVTYGAGGSTRDRTIEIVTRLKQESGLETMMHLTCIGSTPDDIRAVLDTLRAHKIGNILALRGDPPQDQPAGTEPVKAFPYSQDLVAFIREDGGFGIAAAGFPEGHPECQTKEEDVVRLKEKVDAGAEYIITQLFFDNSHYFDYVERLRGIGVTVPIVPGILPVTSFSQLMKFTSMCGASVPAAMVQVLEPIADDKEAVVNYGIEYATQQCRELLDGGAPGIHFYTLNRARSVTAILEGIR